MSKNTKLKKLKREYNKERQGYHDRQYDILADTMAVVAELRPDESAVKAFLKLSGKKIPPAKSKKVEEWLTAAVVGYVTAAKSENAVKLAWKRARVLNHLYDVHAISPDKIAGEIRARGGIEAIAKEAIKDNPRRPKAEKGTEKASSAAKRNPFKSAKAHQESTGDDADEAEDAPGDDDDQPGIVKVRISPALRAKLLAIKPKRSVKMIGVRIDTDDWLDVVLEVQDVRRLKE